MKVIMSEMEKACIDYSDKFKKSWDYYCISKDAYLAGYKAARRDIVAQMESFRADLWVSGAGEGSDYMNMAKQMAQFSGTGSTTIEISDGAHQIGEKLSGHKDKTAE